jgi:hypothetical protein
MGDAKREMVMTMMNGLEVGDIDIMDEEYFGPPPRFLVEGSGSNYDGDCRDEMESPGLFPGISKLRKLVGAW